MNWEALSTIAAWIGVISVIISLFYLGIQVRQNTKAMKAVTYQAIVNSVLEIDKILVQDAKLMEIWVSGRNNSEKLDKKQRRRFNTLMVMFYHNFENLFFQHKKLLVEHSLYQSWEKFGFNVSKEEGVKSWWNKYSQQFLTDKFRKYIETELSTSNLNDNN